MRLRKADWDLTLPLRDARENDEIISIGDSQMLRWIDELNDIKDADFKVKEIRKTIKRIKKQPNSLPNRREIRRLYEELDRIQFKPDYMCLVIDREKDYRRACRGFKINGVKYVRLLGTNGGVKDSTIVFVSKRLSDELRKRIDNGRDQSVKMIPAKFEAYRALTCSGSTPVSMPKGVLLVNDCETEFFEDIIHLSFVDSDEPVMEYRKNEKITLDESDGYGLMLPSLAERWSEELRLDYVVGGVNTRCAFEKGMVFCFDFLDFADNVAHTRIVKDAWGNEVDLTNVELILTTSMLKLWDSYDSMEHYMRCCQENHYTFGIAKTCPEELDEERDLNYQFIQSYDLTPEQTEELTTHTVSEIKDILSGSVDAAILFMKGAYLNEYSFDSMEDDVGKALMIDRRMYNDPFLKRAMYGMIQKRINSAKIGVLRVSGNYSVISGDPYSLCQNMFGLEVTGLLRAGEIYSKFWMDKGVGEVVCFRAPMTCANNIRKMMVVGGEDAGYWYRYMSTCTILNSWDSSAAALNGADKDGDILFTTDNHVLLDNFSPQPTVMCMQRKAEKILVTEADLIQSNINSFGDDIGKITNWITTMFDVRSQYAPGSDEYKTLSYRIISGQLLQQDAIDKAKGIISKPMPKAWYDRHVNKIEDTDDDATQQRKEYNMRILADKKPYFMRYIYPDLMKQYNTYVKNSNKKCMREFRMTIDELKSLPADGVTESQREFMKYYYDRMPVGTHDCIMNRICHIVEDELDGFFAQHDDDEPFDYTIMKGGYDYTTNQYYSVKKIYEQYQQDIRELSKKSSRGRIDQDTLRCQQYVIAELFKRQCFEVCSDARQLCDIILDLCYVKSGSKQFCWAMCGHEIIENLLENNGRTISFPVQDEDGDIVFGAKRFKNMEMIVD